MSHDDEEDYAANVLLMSQDVEEENEENVATVNGATSSSVVVADVSAGHGLYIDIFGSDSDENNYADDHLVQHRMALATLAESCCKNTAALIDGLRLYLIAINFPNLSEVAKTKKLKTMCKLYSPIDARNPQSDKFLSFQLAFHYLNGQFGTRSSTAQVVATLRTRQRQGRLAEKTFPFIYD